jgi:hypothetical protein
MARPQKQIVEYFTHDVYALSASKTLSIIRDEFGIAGIGFWWELLAWLGHTEGHYYVAQKTEDLEFLTRKLGFPLQDGTRLLDKLAQLQAIDSILWRHKIIWSQNFVDRLAGVYKKRQAELPKKPNYCNGNCNHLDINPVIPVTETPIPDSGILHSIVKYSTSQKKVIKKAPSSPEDFEVYKESLRIEFKDLDFDMEIRKFQSYWSEGNKKLQRPKTALLNWLTKAREFKQKNNGNDGMPTPSEKYTYAKNVGKL